MWKIDVFVIFLSYRARNRDCLPTYFRNNIENDGNRATLKSLYCEISF